jgi:hypothetical protein
MLGTAGLPAMEDAGVRDYRYALLSTN